MAATWRELLPHFFGMLVVYAILVIGVYYAFGIQDFWVSLAIAISIALVYPSLARRLDIAPEAWQRE